jgi:hypothetical protein
MDVNSNVNGLHSEPGFHPEARYEFKVHFEGAAYEDLTWRVSFGEADSGGRQTLQVHALDGEAARDDAAAGELVLAGRTGETASGNGTRAWAGRIADSFYIDLSLLALINGAVAAGTAPDLSGWRPQDAKNSFAGSLVYSIVLEVSHTHPRLRPGARTGVWAATKLATDAGGWRQINRAGHPMMWPIFWPNDTDFTNPANTRHPSEDVSAAAKYIGEQIAAVVAAAGTSDDPASYGQAVARDLFPDMLPYVVGTPAVYGFTGFNGRTQADNAPEAMLWSPATRCLPGSNRPPPRTSGPAPSPTSSPPNHRSRRRPAARASASRAPRTACAGPTPKRSTPNSSDSSDNPPPGRAPVGLAADGSSRTRSPAMAASPCGALGEVVGRVESVAKGSSRHDAQLGEIWPLLDMFLTINPLRQQC